MAITPGPWVYDAAAETIVGADGRVVVYELNTNEDDGLLISAATELFAACKAALGAFERNDCINWDDLSRAIEKAEPKTKGER